MLDLKFVRENPDIVKQNIKNKFQDRKLPLVDEVIELDAKARATQTEADELRAKRKKDSQMIGELKKKGENTDVVQAEVKKIGDDIKELEEKQSALDAKQRDLLLHIPNIPDETTPIGASEDDNVEVYRKNLILNLRLTGIYAKKKILLTLKEA